MNDERAHPVRVPINLCHLARILTVGGGWSIETTVTNMASRTDGYVLVSTRLLSPHLDRPMSMRRKNMNEGRSVWISEETACCQRDIVYRVSAVLG